MAPSSAVTYQVLIEFVPGSGTYVDLSARVSTVTITRPPASQGGEVTPTTVEVVFLNHPVTATEPIGVALPNSVGYCPLSPDSPVAAYFPHVTRDRQLRVNAFWNGGASSAARFRGWVDVWTPDAGGNPPATATVTVSASDVFSRYARIRPRSMYAEQLLHFTGANIEYWSFSESPGATRLRGFSNFGGTTVAGTGVVVNPNGPSGGFAIEGPDVSGHLTDGQLTFSRGSQTSYNAPVVLIRTRKGSQVSSLTFWFKLAQDSLGYSDDLVSAYKSDGTLVWRFSAVIVSGKVRMALWDNTNTQMSWYDTGAARDEGWHASIIYLTDAADTALYQFEAEAPLDASFSGGSLGWSYDPRVFDYLVLGGQMPPNRKGKQVNTFQGSLSSLLVQYGSSNYTFLQYSAPGYVFTTGALLTLYQSNNHVDAKVGGWAGSFIADKTPVVIDNKENMLDIWNAFPRSNNGLIYTGTSGQPVYLGAVQNRSTNVAVSLDVEQDLDAPSGGWVLTKDETPTRVVVSSPLGSYQGVDATTEALTGIPLDAGQISTVAGSESLLASVAARVIYPAAARPSSFGVDLTTTSTDKLTALLTVQPGGRVRLSGLPPALNGVSYVDVYLAGWVEVFDADQQSCRFTNITTRPADDPPEAVFDDAEYGRFGMASATVTGGTAIGSTGNGTLIITSTDPLSTAAGAYPADLDWNGERVTITAAPVSATSPQTVTTTSRGVAPTVARVHGAGESIDGWHSMRFGG